MKEFLLSMQKNIGKINKVKKAALFASVAFLLSTNIWAQGGTTGPLTWSLSDDGVLTISRKGAMPDYEWLDSPWIPYFQSIKTIVIENGVTSIGESGFAGFLNMVSIIIPNSVTTIGNWAFWECGSLTSIVIPNSIIAIGNGAFVSCYSLISVAIPSSVTVIEDGTFEYCVGLTSISIPNSVTAIGERAFDYCSGLVEIINLNPVPQVIDPNVFYNVDQATCILTMRNSALEAYKAANVWKDFNIIGGDYMIDALPNNVAHGNVDGGGLYAAGATVSLTAAANSGYQFESWTSDGVVVSAENPYTFTVTGDITITANFKSDGTFIDDVKNQLHEIFVYPNPATDKIYLSSPELEIRQAILFNPLGQKVAEATTSEINLNNLPTGLYILQITTDKGVMKQKIIKQ